MWVNRNFHTYSDGENINWWLLFGAQIFKFYQSIKCSYPLTQCFTYRNQWLKKTKLSNVPKGEYTVCQSSIVENSK